MKEIVKAKLAATLMLCRDNNGTLEVLLLKRNKALAFAAGLWVFPGGKIEAAEMEQAENEVDAAKLAAVRETKEETNIEVHPDQLLFFRHWTTPEAEKRRFATYFFFASIDYKNSEVIIDDSEIKAHKWLSPNAALKLFSQKQLPMMPPTSMSLQLINKCSSTIEAWDLVSQIQPSYVLPIIRMDSGEVICIYEGDAAYETGKADTLGARHRLIMDVVNGGFEFQFADCPEGIIPVNGGMHL